MTLTEQFPPLPITELVAGIKQFPLGSSEKQREFISRLLDHHPVLTVAFGGNGRYRRARKIRMDIRTDKVQDLLWNPDGVAAAGRANPEGFSVLYLADRRETAFSEIRVEDDTVLLAELQIRSGKEFMVAPIGEFMQIQRTGRGYLCGDSSKHISDMLNACDPGDAKALLIADAFLYECLVGDTEDYKLSSWVAMSIFKKNKNCSAVAYSSVRQCGATNFAVRTDSFWDSWGVISAKRMHVKNLACGYYDSVDIEHVTGITSNGKLCWDSTQDKENSTILLAPLWTPS